VAPQGEEALAKEILVAIEDQAPVRAFGKNRFQ